MSCYWQIYFTGYSLLSITNLTAVNLSHVMKYGRKQRPNSCQNRNEKWKLRVLGFISERRKMCVFIYTHIQRILHTQKDSLADTLQDV